MRNELLRELTTKAHEDGRILFLTADLGFGVVEEFRDTHSARFFNVGVAEQGMVALATGLAQGGFTPYCYSIATFASLRALEFIRNGPAVHNLPVRIIGVGPGFDYSNDGITHYALDDISALRAMPGVLIWAPSFIEELKEGLARVQEYAGPVYIRVPRREPPRSPGTRSAEQLSQGQICLVCFGDAIPESESILEAFNERGVEVALRYANWISPSDLDQLVTSLQAFDTIVAVETHYARGGFGSALAETFSRRGISTAVLAAGIESLPIGELGSRTMLNERFGFQPSAVVKQALEQTTLRHYDA